jgi:hypothetical protein
MRYIKPAVLSITDAMFTIKDMAKNSLNPEGDQPSIAVSYEADE